VAECAASSAVNSPAPLARSARNALGTAGPLPLYCSLAAGSEALIYGATETPWSRGRTHSDCALSPRILPGKKSYPSLALSFSRTREDHPDPSLIP
jgi:hypothetical protein